MAGLVTPNYGQMGTEVLPSGNGMAVPYGPPASNAAPTDAGASMQGPQSPAQALIGYRPEAGRADRLGANIVGGSSFDNLASGGYSSGGRERL